MVPAAQGFSQAQVVDDVNRIVAHIAEGGNVTPDMQLSRDLAFSFLDVGLLQRTVSKRFEIELEDLHKTTTVGEIHTRVRVLLGTRFNQEPV